MCTLLCRYVRALGAMYLRLVGESLECYKYLELLYNDYRKLKRKNRNGGKCHSDMGSISWVQPRQELPQLTPAWIEERISEVLTSYPLVPVPYPPPLMQSEMAGGGRVW